MSKILGVDYGYKRIGVAISDTKYCFAFEKKILKNTNLKSLIAQFKEICQNENIIKIIIGLPLDPNGKETELSKEVRRFTNTINQKLEIETIYIDERYTSKLGEKVINIHPKKKIRYKGRKTKDSLEAAIILQTFLDQKHNVKNL